MISKSKYYNNNINVHRHDDSQNVVKCHHDNIIHYYTFICRDIIYDKRIIIISRKKSMANKYIYICKKVHSNICIFGFYSPQQMYWQDISILRKIIKMILILRFINMQF